MYYQYKHYTFTTVYEWWPTYYYFKDETSRFMSPLTDGPVPTRYQVVSIVCQSYVRQLDCGVVY